MYCGRDFDPADVGESSVFSLDFAKEMQPGDTISSVVWSCVVAPTSKTSDADPASRLQGIPVKSGTKASQRVAGLQAGVIYTLQAMIVTAYGDHLSLWANVECKAFP